MARFEIRFWERGKTYRTDRAYLVKTPRATLLIYGGYEHDADSVVPNIAEPIDDCHKYIVPAVHDFGYDYQCDATGTLLPRETWDWIYWYLCKHSNSWRRRVVADLRYWGVRKFGRGFWNKTLDPLPLPKHAAWMYGTDNLAWQAQARVPVLIVGTDGRLTLLPPRIRP